LADGTLASGTQYRAFLSYSHKDEALAGKIHRRLESYRLPKNLVGTETAHGPVPARLTPIFRDREELSAGESLSERIRAALEVSDSLIILCSPNAKASHWVGQEIRLFRELHPDRPVLAALIEGEPEEAFPDPLTEGGAEPIAPDFRKGKDGFRLGLLKLVAGLSGVPLDALVQRDAQRQLRRVTAITGGALAAVLVMALLLVTAIRSQREAERQRAEAEGLVEYMLTDLRDRLKGVGRLDVMTAVNERAMRYYGVETPDGQLLKARILHAMGEDDDKRGNLDVASKRFAEAFGITSSVLKQNPENERAIFTHAQSEYWMGYVALFGGTPKNALQGFSRYQALTQRLTSRAPQNYLYQREAAYAEGNLCSTYLEAPQQPQRAVKSCTSALDAMRKASALAPQDEAALLSLPNRHAWLADAFLAEGDSEQALLHRRKQASLVDEQLAIKPHDARWIEAFVASRNSLGTLLHTLGRFEEADEVLLEGILLARKRAVEDPSNDSMKRHLRGMNSIYGRKDKDDDKQPS
jgi:tetratricopeptide (TPR) repeat protein